MPMRATSEIFLTGDREAGRPSQPIQENYKTNAYHDMRGRHPARL